MRLAWIGGGPGREGLGEFARALISGMLDKGMEVVVFTYDPLDRIHDALGDHANLQVVHEPLHWEWNRWYSSNPASVFLSSFLARISAYKRLVRLLVSLNRETRFDCVLQFSQTEIFNMSRYLSELPNVLVFPCVHAAGELRWHRKESRWALASEPLWRHWIVRANLVYRSWSQRKTLKRVYGQVGMSSRFNELLRRDYRVRANRQAVVYQPIPSRRERSRSARETGGKIHLVFVGRISVRKGVDLLIDLSHRLDDLAGTVQLTVVGGPSFWSDYSSHLSKLNPRIAQHVGAMSNANVLRLFGQSDILLLPSKYEPGGIVVAEALSQGCYLVVSDEVGSAERLSSSVVRKFRSGDADAFEAACRLAIRDVQVDDGVFRQRCRDESESKFSNEQAICRLTDAIHAAVAGRDLTAISPQQSAGVYSCT